MNARNEQRHGISVVPILGTSEEKSWSELPRCSISAEEWACWPKRCPKNANKAFHTLARILGKVLDSAPNVGTSQLRIRSAGYPAAALKEWNQGERVNPESLKGQHEP